MVNSKVKVTASKHEFKTVTYRDLNSVNFEQFSAEIKERNKVVAYNTLMKEIADNYASLKKIKIVPNAPCFDYEYKQLRKLRRKAWKKYKNSGLKIKQNL